MLPTQRAIAVQQRADQLRIIARTKVENDAFLKTRREALISVPGREEAIGADLSAMVLKEHTVGP